MIQKPPTEYRTFELPGLGRVTAPAHMTEEQLLAELHTDDDGETGKAQNDKR
ncbi:hypothetical protein GCM10007385_44130 [Tateyamaria omphalii]|nr:hypothetical protein GCM10007385_44130 [Tateyamaria omphalii]